MKTILAMILFAAMASYSGAQEIKNFYEFTVTDIDGNKYQLSQLEGKKVPNWKNYTKNTADPIS
jgi:hypothetical protein